MCSQRMNQRVLRKEFLGSEQHRLNKLNTATQWRPAILQLVGRDEYYKPNYSL